MTIPVQECKSKIARFYNNFVVPLTGKYRDIIVDNLMNDDNPRIRIRYGTNLCIITYGDYNTQQYSLNWYVNEKKSVPEMVSHDMNAIALQLDLDAKTYFS